MPLAAALLTLALNWPLARSVFAGGFGDPDDAMRLVEVRAWLAGQPWFDVAAHRLDPPFGASMHWSRLVDLANAALIRVFSLVSDRPETWDRLVLPFLLLVALYAGIARLATVLAGPAARWPAMLGMVLCGPTLVLFAPGRIGHHGPEAVALVWATALLLQSFGARNLLHAAGAGALVALMLAMSLETLPYLGLLGVAILVRWVLRGEPAVPTLLGFCAGLGLALPALFVAEVAPAEWGAPVCDALGAAHLGAALIFAIGGAALTATSPFRATRRGRISGAVLLAGAAGGFGALAYPACLGSPFAQVDPLVRQVWLSKVVESLPIASFARGRLVVAAALILPMALGGVCALGAAIRHRGAARDRFAVVAALCAAGLLVGAWQVRGFTSVAPFAVLGGLPAVSALARSLRGVQLRHPAAWANLAILPFASTAWALALPPTALANAEGPNCLTPAAFRPLAGLAPGRMLAPLQAGAHLLEATPHSVFAAPYHRNNDGNRFELDSFLAPTGEAERLLRGRGVTYVAICPGFGETAALARSAPDSLAAALLAGVAPPFLAPMPLAGTPFRLWAVIPKP